jgi:hypothetical protein
MLMAMPLLASTPVKAKPVNCEPLDRIEDLWLVVTSKGIFQSLDEGRSIVTDNRHDRTRRVAQSGTPAR